MFATKNCRVSTNQWNPKLDTSQKDRAQGIGVLFDLLKDDKQITRLIDDRCQTLHNSDNLEQLTEFFKTVLLEVDELSFQQKSNILLQLHCDLIIDQFVVSDKISKIFDAIFQEMELKATDQQAKEMIRLKVKEILKRHIISTHLTLPSFALAGALNRDPNDVKFSSGVVENQEGLLSKIKQGCNKDLYKV